MFLLVISFAAVDAGALEVQQSPYDKIAERNLFQLHAATVLIKDSAPKPPPLRKVTLTGITTILKRTVAFITIEGTKGQPAESMMIEESQALDGIEVRAIDEKAGVVKILNGDEMQILNFELPNSSGTQPSQPRMIPSAPAPQMQVRPEATLTSEEQTALIELQRIKFQQEGNPSRLLLPPTELTPDDQSSAMP